MRAEVDMLLYAVRQEDLLATDAIEALKVVPGIREELDGFERALIESLMDAGLSWQMVGEVVWGVCRQTAARRYRRLGGIRRWPTGPRGSR
jgi:hypothetical protein